MPRSLRTQGPVAKVLLRLPSEVHEAISTAAKDAGVSFNEYCVRRLSAPSDHTAVSEARIRVVTRALSLFGDQFLGAIVMGSWARGESGDGSDVDVLLVLHPATALTRDLYRRWDGAPQTIEGRVVDVHFTHLPSTGASPTVAWCEAAIDGQLWYDRDGTVGARLGEVRRAIAEGRVVRSFVHGQPYWKGAA